MPAKWVMVQDVSPPATEQLCVRNLIPPTATVACSLTGMLVYHYPFHELVRGLGERVSQAFSLGKRVAPPHTTWSDRDYSGQTIIELIP
eukprot:6947149-Pyramimonas_sp.AAC.3